MQDFNSKSGDMSTCVQKLRLWLCLLIIIFAMFSSICIQSVLLIIAGYYIYKYFAVIEDIPHISWGTPFILGDRLIECPQTCLVTSDKSAKAVIFYGSHLNNSLPRWKNNGVLWALYHEESPKNFPALLDRSLQGVFNVTATFSRHSHYPLTLQYLKDYRLITDKKYFMSVSDKNKLDFAPVLYIQSNCDTVNNRDQLVLELMQYIDVDSYGTCLNNKKLPESLVNVDNLDVYNEQFLAFIAQYKFIISFENANCEDYITEKLWRPLIVGSVPVYWGSPTVQDWLPNNSSVILVQDFENMAKLAEFLHRVDGNDTLYNLHLQHKISGTINNANLTINPFEEMHPILGFECYVCATLHGSHPLKLVQENIYKCGNV